MRHQAGPGCGEVHQRVAGPHPDKGKKIDTRGISKKESKVRRIAREREKAVEINGNQVTGDQYLRERSTQREGEWMMRAAHRRRDTDLSHSCRGVCVSHDPIERLRVVRDMTRLPKGAS